MIKQIILIFLTLFVLTSCGSSGGSTNTTEQIDDNTDTAPDENTSSTVTIGSWEEIQTQNSPGVRTNHTIVDINGTLYLYGGDDGVARIGQARTGLSDLWVCTPESGMYRELTPSSQTPPPRKYHKAIVKNNKMYIFGGVNNEYIPTSDAWVYDPSVDTWAKLFDASNSEFADRSYQDTIVDKDGNIYISGGMVTGTSGSAYSDVIKYDIATNTLTQVASCDYEYARFGHSSFVYDGKFYMAFGKSGDTFKNDMVEIDLNTGTCKTVTQIGPVPKPTKFANATIVNDTLIYFGGYSKDEENKELWKYDMPTKTWTQKDDILVANNGTAVWTTYQNNPGIFYQGGINSTLTWFLSVGVE